ncbi:unnamed protein product [Adineta steineri]|uniref:Uncharacterized protein n=1 Tax=Adineta steineri TaxID=433720 RepID=A0A819MIP3_9BILA|nr:unnamed protein product [Adineta steineri]CAF3980148.1 unnamed protein product [Adineta steineri]
MGMPMLCVRYVKPLVRWMKKQQWRDDDCAGDRIAGCKLIGMHQFQFGSVPILELDWNWNWSELVGIGIGRNWSRIGWNWNWLELVEIDMKLTQND